MDIQKVNSMCFDLLIEGVKTGEDVKKIAALALFDKVHSKLISAENTTKVEIEQFESFINTIKQCDSVEHLNECYAALILSCQPECFLDEFEL